MIEVEHKSVDFAELFLLILRDGFNILVLNSKRNVILEFLFM